MGSGNERGASVSQEEVVFAGRIGEVVHTTQPDGRVFERYRRAPGVRLIVVTPAGKLLLTREDRQETGGVDLRLPGGKVCDTLEEYHALLASAQDMTDAAREAAVKEGHQELGLELSDLELVVITADGATVEWDLYYFKTDNYTASQDGQQLEAGEDITLVEMTPGEIRAAIAKGEMQEWRTVGVLLANVLPQLEAAGGAA